jgi:hypothetical protein
MTDRQKLNHMIVQYVLLALGALVLGYIAGRVDSLHSRLRGLEQNQQVPRYELAKPKKWLTQDDAAPKAGISIDTSKVVTKVDTVGMEKLTDAALGETTSVQDDINAAANRLANLKRS